MIRKKISYLLVLLMLTLPIGVLAAENPNPPAQPDELTLNQCLDMALKNNKSIQEAEKNVAIARDAVKQAEAAFGPTVGYQVSQDISDVTQYKVGSSYEKTELIAGLSASLPLYTGGLLENQLKLSKLQLESAKETARKSKQQLIYNVKQAFYNVWLAEQILQVQQSSYANMQQHVVRVEALYKVGTASKFELLRAEVQRDTLKPKVISAQNQLALAKLQLATTIGLPKEKSYNVVYDINTLQLPKSVNLNLQKILDEAYQNRAELRQLRQLAEIKKTQTKMAENGYKPNVALTATYGGVNKYPSLSDWTTAFELTLSVTGKVYDRTIQTKVDQARGSEELTAIQEADLQDQIRLDAEQAIQNLELGIETTQANQANLELAKESLRMTQARFNNGMATTMDIMDAQLALDQAYNGYYQGVVTYLIAEAKIDMVTGRD